MFGLYVTRRLTVLLKPYLFSMKWWNSASELKPSLQPWVSRPSYLSDTPLLFTGLVLSPQNTFPWVYRMCLTSDFFLYFWRLYFDCVSSLSLKGKIQGVEGGLRYLSSYALKVCHPQTL